MTQYSASDQRRIRAAISKRSRPADLGLKCAPGPAEPVLQGGNQRLQNGSAALAQHIRTRTSAVEVGREIAASSVRSTTQRIGFEMIRLLRLWRLGARDLRLLWFALHHERRPAWLWPAAVFLGLYALEPFNFAIPFLGVIDDFVILPLLLHLLVALLPAQIRAGSSRRSLLR